MSKPLPPVELGNSLDLPTYISTFLPSEPLTFQPPNSITTYSISMESSKIIDKIDLETCFKLIETTSKPDYTTSGMGWNPRKKRKEMKLLDLRYLLVRSPTNTEGEGGDVEAFASFMLTYEDGEEVVYLYEIHLGEELRGSGLGRYLMDLVENVGRKAGMGKCMLTVFMSNEAARKFYERLGYDVDEFSPGPRRLRNGVVKEADYVILSKKLGA